ncbi:sugar transporter, putative [Perkinsus marinus ATCC 50983]|uniref:Sugar transporter, putative n=1 Tax=Perkinsus marinus (strain ATCC 50983 / TXsc) TaxID=423536 RepID=C5L9I1_PERM5|nr:sugar transporter, putative [Perkinsus marinus ATCC 50983]EER06612.1 sugar transporter, putative [Perkinsus marinus ATCC 50983]|eukprot:XP_002774796.1 sugar transporter, putative [Perkinsus marinus ATCC 50983]
MAYSLEGPDWLRKCLAPQSFKVFSLIGVFFAIGDILEMQSMSAMDGAVYQVLGQSKLIVTAITLWAVKGHNQTALEWVVLALIVASMSTFVLEDHNNSTRSEASYYVSQPQESLFSKLLGIGYVMFKVTISCLCAVLADKYMKQFSDVPFYIQMAQYKIAWFTTCVALAYALDWEGELTQFGFFHGWTWSTLLVTISFTIKGWCTMYLLRSLDSVLKNIGEALAVIAVYLCSILLWGKAFDSAAFLSMSSVVLAVVTYTLVVRLETKNKRLMYMLVEIQDDVPFVSAPAPSGDKR